MRLLIIILFLLQVSYRKTIASLKIRYHVSFKKTIFISVINLLNIYVYTTVITLTYLYIIENFI